MIDQVPYQLLTVFKRAAHDSLSMRGKEKRLSSIRCDLNKAMVGGRFQSLLTLCWVSVDDRTGKIS